MDVAPRLCPHHPPCRCRRHRPLHDPWRFPQRGHAFPDPGLYVAAPRSIARAERGLVGTFCLKKEAHVQWLVRCAP